MILLIKKRQLVLRKNWAHATGSLKRSHELSALILGTLSSVMGGIGDFLNFLSVKLKFIQVYIFVCSILLYNHRKFLYWITTSFSLDIYKIVTVPKCMPKPVENSQQPRYILVINYLCNQKDWCLKYAIFQPGSTLPTPPN